MKKLLITIFLVSLFSCRRSGDLNTIVGSWELRKSVGGFAGTINYPPGNGHIYSFAPNGTYTLSNNGVVGESGTYELLPVLATNDWHLKMTSTLNNSVFVDSIHLEANQLIFLPMAACCDIPATIFERVP